MTLFKEIVELLKETVREWLEDGGSQIAAALAYYAIFSLSPLLIIVSIAIGLVMDPNTVQTSLVSGLQSTLGQQAAQLISSMFQHNAKTTDVIGTIVWFAIVFWGASGMFAHLQSALNKIWDVKLKPGRSVVVLAKDRSLSFVIVILAALALLGTMVINAALSELANRGHVTLGEVLTVAQTSQAATLFSVGAPLSTAALVALRIGQFALTVAITTGLIAVIYRVLPEVEISWEDVIVGSVFTAVLLFVGQFAVGVYLSHASIGSVFGAAGSLTIILVWVYYSAQILLFGAEFTQVWARHYGQYIVPDKDAMWENVEAEEEHAREAGDDWAKIDPASKPGTQGT